MNNSFTKVEMNKVLPITLKMLPQIIEASQKFHKSYRNCTFEYISFVGRVTKPCPDIEFSDETQVLGLNIYHRQYLSNFACGSYYQCLCKLRNVGTTSKLEVINRSEAEGNQITVHMMRVMKEEQRRRIMKMEVERQEEAKEEEQERSEEELYKDMYEWMQNKQRFTVQELEQEFVEKADRSLFNSVFSRLEDEQLIGNMGAVYEWIV